MVPFPLTRARFLEYAIARSGNSPFAEVDPVTIDRWVAWASATIQSAMGDRIVPPLLQMDECLEGHAVMLAWRPIMTARGYKKDQGRDSEVGELAKQADAFCQRLRDKSENPTFVDSSPTGIGTRDSIAIVSGTRVEYWRRNGACGGCQ